MSKKVIGYIIIALCLFVGIILLDTLQALIFNNNPIIGTETYCKKKDGIFVSTYHCGDKNFTKLKSSTCSYEDVCGNYLEKVIQDNFEKMLSVNGGISSSTYDYIDNEYYQNIVNLGSGAIPILEKMYEDGKFSQNGLDANIVVILLQEISGCNIKDKYNLSYSTPQEFYTLWKNYKCDSDLKLRIIKSNNSQNNYNLYLEKDNVNTYLSSKIEEVIYNNNSLKFYIINSFQTLDDSIKKVTSLLGNVSTLRDGGTKIYKSDKYDITIVKCNTVMGNRDIYIGNYEMVFDNELMCKR